MKKILFGILLGVIISGTITYAAIKIQANEVGYKNGTVEDALNNLYNQASSKKKICMLLSGTANTIGAKYTCDPGDGIYRIFYVLKLSENTVDLLMDRNITQANSKTIYTYTEAMNYFTSGSGKNIVDNWKNIISISLPSAEDIAHASDYSEWTLQNDNGWFYFESHNNSTANNSGTYAWLYDYLNDCSAAKCYNSLGGNNASGYWTKDLLYSDNSQAKGVYKTGTLTQDLINNIERYGIRPVITVSKNILN